MKQQWILGIGHKEPIHAASVQEEFICLRTTHAIKKIQLILSPRVIDYYDNKYEQVRTKFDQLRPILASVSSKQTHPILPISTTSSTQNLSSDVLIPNSSTFIASDLPPTHKKATLPFLVSPSQQYPFLSTPLFNQQLLQTFTIVFHLQIHFVLFGFKRFLNNTTRTCPIECSPGLSLKLTSLQITSSSNLSWHQQSNQQTYHLFRNLAQVTASMEDL